MTKEIRSRDAGRSLRQHNPSHICSKTPDATGGAPPATEETLMAAANTLELPQTSARAACSQARLTLRPSVQNFNDKIMSRGNSWIADEDQIIWSVERWVATSGSRPHLKFHPPNTIPLDDYAPQSQYTPLPLTATFHQSDNPLPPLHLDSTTRVPLDHHNVIKTERVVTTSTAWTEDVHRRHVARTARARARLAPKQWAMERVVPSGETGMGLDRCLLMPSGKFFNSSRLAATAATTPGMREEMEGDEEEEEEEEHGEEEVRCLVQTPHAYPRTKNYYSELMTSRSRPATTTGRYFDRVNGLRDRKPAAATMSRIRPKTAENWRRTPPGLNVQKLVLRAKDGAAGGGMVETHTIHRDALICGMGTHRPTVH